LRLTQSAAKPTRLSARTWDIDQLAQFTARHLDVDHGAEVSSGPSSRLRSMDSDEVVLAHARVETRRFSHTLFRFLDSSEVAEAAA
jgi:hypothetical protein